MQNPAPYWVVYIVQCNDGSLYTGITNRLDNRIQQHNEGRAAAKYTRSRRPVNLVYHERVDSKSNAYKREQQIKKLTRSRKLALISRHA